MDKSFERGFKKTALLSIGTKLVQGAGKFLLNNTKRLGQGAVKNPGKTVGLSLTLPFMASEANRVVKETSKAMNKRVGTMTDPSTFNSLVR